MKKIKILLAVFLVAGCTDSSNSLVFDNSGALDSSSKNKVVKCVDATKDYQFSFNSNDIQVLDIDAWAGHSFRVLDGLGHERVIKLGDKSIKCQVLGAKKK